MNLWEDFDGEIPEGTLLQVIGGQTLSQHMPIPDLSALNPTCDMLAVPESDPMKYLR